VFFILHIPFLIIAASGQYVFPLNQKFPVYTLYDFFFTMASLFF